jgi:hypothetical protein
LCGRARRREHDGERDERTLCDHGFPLTSAD